MALAAFEVVGVVCRCHFDDARAEFRIRKVVQDNRDLSAHQREADGLAVQILVAGIFGVYRNGSVAKHSFGPCSGDDQMPIGADDRVADMPKVALGFDVGRFEVRKRGAAAWAPVDHVGAAVDESFFV